MMSLTVVPQPDFVSPRHVVSLFPFSLDKTHPNEDVRTRSPKVWTTRARYIAQDRCQMRHFEELFDTSVMTTFLFDLRDPRLANIPRTHIFTKYWTFTSPIDVFTYEIVNRLTVIWLSPGTSCLVSLSTHTLMMF